VFATIEARNPEGGIYRTSDGGATREKTSSLNTRPNYYSQIRVDPRDQQHVYTLGSNRGFYFSDDGGKAFTERFSDVHGEDHALWVDPDNGNHLIIGGDGGVSISWDRGKTWDFRRNMPIGQFYEVDVDNSVPFRICGGLQDNGVWCVPSAVAIATASPTATRGTSAAATASMRTSIRPTTRWSSSRRRTETRRG
jgi:hypothetical protein